MVSLALENGTRRLSLDAFLDTSRPGAQALEGLTGFGLPPVEPAWFVGAGDGAVWRGSRVATREIVLPLLLVGETRAEIAEVFSRIASLLAPSAGEARLRFTEPDGTAWTIRVVRSGGGDFAWGIDTDGLTYLRTEIVLQAGDPYWTRERVSSRTIRTAGVGRGLLQSGVSLSRLRVSSSQALGTVTIENPGDAPAYPVVHVVGPGSNITLRSPAGDEEVRWLGTLADGETLTFDHQRKTVVDHTGANRYEDLDTAPRFWAIPPGTSSAYLAMTGASPDSSVTLTWRPRRWLML